MSDDLDCKLRKLLREIYDNDDFVVAIPIIVGTSANKIAMMKYVTESLSSGAQVTSEEVIEYALYLVDNTDLDTVSVEYDEFGNVISISDL